MSLHTNQFTAMSGLRFDKQSQTYWGNPSGYPVFVTVQPRRDSVIFRLIGKLRDESQNTAMQGAVTEFTASHTGISGMIYENRCLACAVSLTPRDTESALLMRIEELVHFAMEMGLVPCCMSCGTESGYRSYLLDDGGVTVCDNCKPYVESKLQEALEEKAAVRTNWFGIIIGALAGAVCVFFLSYFILQMSYLSFLTGVAGVLIGFALMKKLGKKVTIPAAILCGVLCLIAGIAAPVFETAKELQEYNMDNQVTAQRIVSSYEELRDTLADMTDEEIKAAEEYTGESLDLTPMKSRYEDAKMILAHTSYQPCLKDLKKMLDMDLYNDAKGELIKCMLILALSVVIGTLLIAPGVLKADSGVHTLRELTL